MPLPRRIIDTLLEGADMARAGFRNKARARAFLSHVDHACGSHHELRSFALPVSRRLVVVDGWHHRARVGTIVAFSLRRLDVMGVLRPLRKGSYDPEADYMEDCATCLISEVMESPRWLVDGGGTF